MDKLMINQNLSPSLQEALAAKSLIDLVEAPHD